jgi:hypothetical protein
MAYATNKRVEEAQRKPQTFRGLPVTLGEFVVIYDDEVKADGLARELGTYAKHAGPKFDDTVWDTFSIVKLPEGWFGEP